MTGTHDCPAAGCTRQVPNHMLMCGRHWGQVPAAQRRAVYRAWDTRCQDPHSAAAIAAHLQACENATAAVDGRDPIVLFTGPEVSGDDQDTS